MQGGWTGEIAKSVAQIVSFGVLDLRETTEHQACANPE